DDTRSRDAVQMPVLEKLGLVTGTDEQDARRYELTDRGRAFYRPRASDAEQDFCAVHLSLAQIVRRSEAAAAGGASRVVIVSYTYKVSAPSWARDREFRRVFPMVDRILAGEGKAELEQRFRSDSGRWTAIDPRG